MPIHCVCRRRRDLMRVTLAFFLILVTTQAAFAGNGLNRPVRIHGQLLQATEQACSSTQQCIGEAPFCRNGSVCLHRQCWRLPDFPCVRPDWCDERQRRCIVKHCESWSDCDDGVFCNGEELCVQGRCLLNPGSDCMSNGDLCNEHKQQCTRARSTLDARQRLAQAALDFESFSYSVRAANDSNTSNVTQPPVGSISNTDLVIIFASIGGLVCLFIFFFLIIQATRRQPPAILIEHKSGGSQVYRSEMKY